MNKSVFFNHCLMKRRYSVPETVMRKHKLQESLSRGKKAVSTTTKTTTTTTSTTTTKRSEKSGDNRAAAENDDDAGEARVKDESCQTEACFDCANRVGRYHHAYRRSSRCRKRENLRYFKKTNSYCQYRSLSMFHKKMYDDGKHRGDACDVRYALEEAPNEQPRPQSLARQNGAARERTTQCPAAAAPSIDAIGGIHKSKSDKAISPLKRLNPIVRQNSYPPHDRPTGADATLGDGVDKVGPSPSGAAIARPKIALAGHEKLAANPQPPRRKAFLDYAKSLDQNTSGYNTVCGSLDDTPRRKTPETPTPAAAGNASGGGDQERPGNTRRLPSSARQFAAFPFTFHTESVFLQPHENGGFLSHKELHHISIQLVPDTKIEDKAATATDGRQPSTNDDDDVFESSEVDVNDRQPRAEEEAATATTTTRQPMGGRDRKDKGGGGEAPAKTLSDISEKSVDKDEKCDLEMEATNTTRDDADSSAAVATTVDDARPPPPATTIDHQPTKLKIEIDVPSLDLSKSLREMLLGDKGSSSEPPPATAPAATAAGDESATKSSRPTDRADAYASKAALNYLFQRLGDAYPKRRILLKQPTLPDDGGERRHRARHYADCCGSVAAVAAATTTTASEQQPRRGGAEIPPHKVRFNHRTYEILSGNPLPNEWSTGEYVYDEEDDEDYGDELAMGTHSSHHLAGILADVVNNNDDDDGNGDRLSDSDISIPDSLEDFQQRTKLKHQHHRQQPRINNKYDKYDERLTRGDICGGGGGGATKAPPAKRQRRYGRSVAYFLPLGESSSLSSSSRSWSSSSKSSPSMPPKLREKLRKRSKSLSRHLLCVETRTATTRPKKSPRRGRLVHKRVQTSLNGAGAANASPADEKSGSAAETRRSDASARALDGADLDEKIMDILLQGLKMQEGPADEAAQRAGGVRSSSPDAAGAGAAADGRGAVVSEYVEMYRVTTPVDDDDDRDRRLPADVERDGRCSFFGGDCATSPPSLANDGVYEVTLSEEEVGRANAVNYYKSIKKSRKIYYPAKGGAADTTRAGDEDSTPTVVRQAPPQPPPPRPNQNIPCFSKYQKKLREFKQQIRKHNCCDKVDPLLASGGPDAAAVVSSTEDGGPPAAADSHPRHARTRKLWWREKHKLLKSHGGKTPGVRYNRFYQRFEAIPEEMSTSGAEPSAADRGHESRDRTAVDGAESAAADRPSNEDENRNVGGELHRTNGQTKVAATNGNEERASRMEKRSSERERAKATSGLANDGGDAAECEYKDELKSQKGRNSICVVQQQEELITLSRGWINFYLLNGNSTDDNEVVEEVEEENAALTETSRIPQHYSVHVQAKPQNSTTNTLKTSTLPGLCRSVPDNQTSRNERFKQADKTILPDISHSSSRHKIINSNLQNFRSKNAFPKLQQSDESDTSKRTNMELTAAEPVNPHDISAKEMQPSDAISIHSESSADEMSEKDRLKKLQRYHRPHTYHATRRSNQWSLTIEGNHGAGEKRASDIEMQLFVKNKNNRNPNQSWKFCIKNEGIKSNGKIDIRLKIAANQMDIIFTEMSRTQYHDRNVDRGYLPHLNVNYEMLPLPIYHDESASYSENNSRSNSARNARNTKKIKDGSSRNPNRFNGDMRLQFGRSEEDLTVTGLAITPERKPKAPTMSERDLNRMKLLRQTSVENKIT